MEFKKGNITVSVRIKPTLNSTGSSSLNIISKVPAVLAVVDRPQIYHFDNIFSEDDNQEKIYNETVRPLINQIKLGYKCTVFAYGQTGTGKTYTMGTEFNQSINSLNVGIIPRALKELFNEDKSNADDVIDIFISFLEIYNEKVYDLLQPDIKTSLPVSGFVVQGLSMKQVRNEDEAQKLLDFGNKNRHTGETKQNLNSSRSHAIFTIYFTVRNNMKIMTGKLNLVDLAGSESVKKTGNRGSTFQEGVNINKGLLSIGQVISALSIKSSYIPYRLSMVTSILKGSLNVDNYISLIACLSSNLDDITETVQTLDFSQRAKKINSNPEVNQIIERYKGFSNAPSRFSTPLKRQNNTSFKTPSVKKVALPQLPFINESENSRVINIDNSKSQLAINSSLSSMVISREDFSQEILSPVVRKYMTRMEVTLMDRLESVIKSSLRSSPKASHLVQGECNKENTPCVSWNKIQNEVTKLVRNEIVQLTTKPLRAVSSPIKDQDELQVKRFLNYDSPENLDITEFEGQKLSHQNDFNFKVPELPEPKKEQARFSESNVKPRRSMRLMMKNAYNDNTINISEISFDINNPDEAQNSTRIGEDSTQYETPRHNVKSTDTSILSTVTKNNKSMLERRRSIRIEYNRIKTIQKNSPFTTHSKEVLRILNVGNLKELGKLHSVGSKTAERILLYRKLKGRFKEIEDLSDILGRGTKRFEKFMVLNFLTRD